MPGVDTTDLVLSSLPTSEPQSGSLFADVRELLRGNSVNSGLQRAVDRIMNDLWASPFGKAEVQGERLSNSVLNCADDGVRRGLSEPWLLAGRRCG